MPNIHQFLHAARCGFTYYESINRFVRFLIRDDGRGYDVSAARPEAVLDCHPATTLFPKLPLDSETLRRIVMLCPDLSALERAPERVIHLVLDEHGRVRTEMAHESREVPS